MSSDFESQLAKFAQNNEWLLGVLTGDENHTEIVGGLVKPSITKAISDQFAAVIAVVQGRIPYESLALLNASGAPTADEDGNFPLAEVWRDGVNNGVYGWTGAAWEKSDNATEEVDFYLGDRQSLMLFAMSAVLSTLSNSGKSTSNTVYPLLVDSDGKVLLGVGSDGKLIADLSSSLIAPTLNAFHYNNSYLKSISSDVYPVLVSATGQVLLGVDSNGKLIADIDADSIKVDSEKDYKLSAQNHVMFYGQSLSLGVGSRPAVTLSSKYENLTFAGGPRAAGYSFLPLKSLVEDNVIHISGNNGVGESPCSGAADQLSKQLVRLGHDWSTEKILSTAAGRGGENLSDLVKGSTWYDDVVDKHLRNAANSNSENQLMAVCWMQGESDIELTTTESDYTQMLLGLIDDIRTDAALLNESQSSSPYFLTYQTSYKITEHDDMAMSQLAVANADKSGMACPCYHLPFISDSVHLTNQGSLLIGEYFGAAIAELQKGKVPHISPVSAFKEGLDITVSYSVPYPPMVIDTTYLAATVDHGVTVQDDNGVIPITSISVQNDNELTFTLSRDVVGVAEYRYAMDNLASGLNILSGASGNLRDSREAFAANGQQLYNIMPHHKLNILEVL